MSTTILDNSIRARRTPTAGHRVQSVLVLTLIWAIGLLVLLLGSPLIIYQAISSVINRKE